MHLFGLQFQKLIHPAYSLIRKKHRTHNFDFEYNLLGLPAPTEVIFLDMPPESAEKLMKKREETEDIHERDKGYMKACYDSAKSLSEKYS